jgi:hypothetical protein
VQLQDPLTAFHADIVVDKVHGTSCWSLPWSNFEQGLQARSAMHFIYHNIRMESRQRVLQLHSLASKALAQLQQLSSMTG